MDPSKETHPDKPYYLHAGECRELASRLMREVYSYPKGLVDFALLLSELHDVGKLLPEWSLSRREGRPHHGIEGAEWLLRENIELNIGPPYHKILAYAIMTHHSMLHIPDEVENMIDSAENIRSRRFKEYSKCRSLVRGLNSIIEGLGKGDRLDLADAIGIVKLADMISAKNLPKDSVLMQYNSLPSDFEERIVEGVRERARNKKLAFDHAKFERQKEIASSKERDLLVAAPTGWGKTALALIRMAKVRPIKTFYILPTITAIKDFYTTLTRIFGEAYVGEYFYFADVELLGARGSGEDWDLLDFYRYFIPRVTLTTIDQLLLTMLQVGKYHVRRFNLRNSLLIFDEFHLFTPQMIACLRIFLRSLLKHYNASCLFMSATPSPVYGELLREADPQLRPVILSDDYRRLRRHKIEYCCDETVKDLIARRRDLLSERRTLIIVNTVGRAQEIYLDLKEDLGGSRKIALIHGDFAYKDRMEKEGQINGADVLVSTQVAEVSLDISFDLLITELSPIPSLVQRLGRVNRYGAEPDETNVFICRQEGDRPYEPAQMSSARENLPTLLENLERVGEEAYLNDEFWRYEQPYRDDVEEMEQRITDIMDNIMLSFFSFKAGEWDASKILGREETYLAIPDIYLESVLDLHKRLKAARGYEERRSLYTQIKQYLAPASRSDTWRMEFVDELGLYKIRGYDGEVGIRRIDGACPR